MYGLIIFNSQTPCSMKENAYQTQKTLAKMSSNITRSMHTKVVVKKACFSALFFYFEPNKNAV